MRKIILSLFISLIFVIPVSAATYNAADRVQEVGEKLYKSSGIPVTNVKFTVVSDTPNNSDYATTKVVNISSAELSFAGNDNEVAAVVGAEIGHIILGHGSKQKVIEMFETTSTTSSKTETAGKIQTFSSNYKTSKQDKEADLIGVNLMVNAGYNPLAMIVVLTKQTGTYWDAIVGRPANADKALNVYDYVSYVYPAKIKAGYGCNEYKNFKAYADEVIAERNNNAALSQANKKTYEKAKNNTSKNISKFKIRGGLSLWDAILGILKLSK